MAKALIPQPSQAIPLVQHRGGGRSAALAALAVIITRSWQNTAVPPAAPSKAWPSGPAGARQDTGIPHQSAGGCRHCQVIAGTKKPGSLEGSREVTEEKYGRKCAHLAL